MRIIFVNMDASPAAEANVLTCSETTHQETASFLCHGNLLKRKQKIWLKMWIQTIAAFGGYLIWLIVQECIGSLTLFFLLR